MIHRLPFQRASLHGAFSRDRAPIVTVDSGDQVLLQTLEAGWGLEGPGPDGTPGRKVEDRMPGADDGHCLVGPIALRGAEPGMALEIHINALRPGPWGWTAVGAWPSAVDDRLGIADGTVTMLRWTLDPGAGTGRDQYGRQLALRPHLGVIGLPADEPGWQPTPPPRFCGGNMDCQDFGVGASVFLPIAVPGGLLSVGDGHARMGDGEVAGTGIECPMDEVDLTLSLHPGLQLKTPRARIDGAWLTLGFHEDLDEATYIALEAMLDLMGDLHGLPRRQALALASLVVDLRITQIVNGVRGVHAILRDGAIQFP